MFWLENLRHAATVMSEGALELKYLSHSEAEDVAVASILRLSNSIFNPKPEVSYRASLEEWKRRLSDPASNIIYLVPRSDPDRFPASSEDSRDDKSPLEEVPGPLPVGFIFAYPRSHPEPLKNGSSRSLHIWLAGVLEEHRGRGCLGTMVNALIDLEKRRPARGSGESSTPMPMTICTNPSMFPSMWNWLRARTRWVIEKEFDGGKVMFSLTGR